MCVSGFLAWLFSSRLGVGAGIKLATRYVRVTPDAAFLQSGCILEVLHPALQCKPFSGNPATIKSKSTSANPLCKPV